MIVDAFLGQPPGDAPIKALRAAFRAVFDTLSNQQVSQRQERTQLILSAPELRAAMLDQLASAMRLLAHVIAERTGHQPDAMAVRTLAGAVVGVVIAV
jgi:hypothetical protein